MGSPRIVTHFEIVTTAQAVYYYTNYQRDPWYFKLLVGWVVFLDLFHQICIEHNGEYLLSLQVKARTYAMVLGYMYEIMNWNVRALTDKLNIPLKTDC